MALYASSTALLISWTIAPVILVAAACVVAAYAFVRLVRYLPDRFRPIPAGTAVALTVLLLIAACIPATSDGPFEYEAAARACRAIATEFPRNDWLVISPVHELAFTYGRGWHFELVDFVRDYSARQITPPGFSFPYQADHVFVFVEKQPLRSPRRDGQPDDLALMDLTQTMDRAVLAYNTNPGRASIEFQAAALLSAYMMNHRGMSIFYEDERLVVFHIERGLR